MDLSAMLDGELDAASVRRVLVHSDACPNCGAFLDGIRAQARAHRELQAVLTAADGETVLVSSGGEVCETEAGELRRQLTANRQQLGRILYELGRGFVLMGTSPRFSREVQREPVPAPDMFRRGELLLEEVERIASDDRSGSDAPWVRAKTLFAQREVRSPLENLQKGKRLLRESLSLDPSRYEPRIYLGHAYHVEDDHRLARLEFEAVVDGDDELGRVFGLMHLGNLQIDEGEWDGAYASFLRIVETRVIEEHVQFGMVFFNLALCCGHLRRFEECQDWLHRLYREMPHKRRVIAEEFRSQRQFASLLADHPHILDSFVDEFPCWFPIGAGGS